LPATSGSVTVGHYDLTTMDRGRLAHFRCIGIRRIAPASVRDSGELFSMVLLGQAWRILVLVSDAPIHRCQARGVEVADHVDLHRRGLAGEKLHAIARRMAAKVHKDVDAVVADETVYRFITLAGGFLPMVGQRSQPSRGQIRFGHVAVAEDFEGVVIVMLQSGSNETRNRLLPKIGRDIPDTQPAIGNTIVFVRRNLIEQRVAKPPPPFAMFPIKSGSVVIRRVVNRIEKRTAEARLIGFEFEQLAITAKRQIQFAKLDGDTRQRVMALDVIGAEADRFGVFASRVRRPA